MIDALRDSHGTPRAAEAEALRECKAAGTVHESEETEVSISALLASVSTVPKMPEDLYATVL